jgi:hypothetical protein
VKSWDQGRKDGRSGGNLVMVSFAIFGQRLRTLCNGLDETSQNECQIIPRVKPVPEGTCDESSHASSETRFLPAGRDT